jgi:hypothetical protein
MTSHAFDERADANLDPQPDDGQQAAVNTLRDIYNLTTENLPALTVAARVQTIARAALERFGVPISDDGLALPVPPEIDEPATGWFEDEPPDTAA